MRRWRKHYIGDGWPEPLPTLPYYFRIEKSITPVTGADLRTINIGLQYLIAIEML